jgi:hypothetical protein
VGVADAAVQPARRQGGAVGGDQRRRQPPLRHYDPEGHIVGQVQAMPGYTNVLVMRFDRPGSYQIRCLELCGQYHHIMVRGFEVT